MFAHSAIDLKPLGIGQTFIRMLGYCMKDRGMGHFQSLHSGITQAEIDTGIEEHAALKLDLTSNKIVLGKAVLFNRAFTFWQNHLSATEGVGFAEVVARMVSGNDAKYILSANLFMNAAGQMRQQAAETYWRCIVDGRTTSADVEKILYMPEWSRPPTTRYFQDTDKEARRSSPLTIPRPQVPQMPSDDFVALASAPSPVPVPRATSSSVLPQLDDEEGELPGAVLTGYERVARTLRKLKRARTFILDEADAADAEALDETQDVETAEDRAFIDDSESSDSEE